MPKSSCGNPLPILLDGVRELKNIREPAGPQGSRGAGHELLAPWGGRSMAMLVTHPRGRSATAFLSPLARESPAKLLIRVQSARIALWK